MSDGAVSYVYFVLICILCWIALSILIAQLSGWARLARHYRADAPLDGARFHFQSAGMRFGTNYGGCLTVGVDRKGLYLAVWFLFRFGHPPLLTPWRDITITERKRFFMQQVVFRFDRGPDIPYIISRRLADKIATEQNKLSIV
jgi:hypothetical protein